MAFTIKKGDTLPIITATLTTGPDAGTQAAVDLTTNTFIKLVMKPILGGSATRLNATTVGLPTNGQVKYPWQSADTATAGTFNCEWEVTFGAGQIQTFPNEAYFQVVVADDLG